MIASAKVIMKGRSQAIRLPRQFRVDTDIVFLKKTSEGFLVTTRCPWSLFEEGIRELSEDFMASGRHQPFIQKRNLKA